MATLHSLRQRRRLPEIMDQPNLDERQHIQALHGLERINRWTDSVRLLWRPISTAARQVAPARLRVLDVATGAGDTPIRLWRRAQKAGIPLDITGCDRSPTALDYARKTAASQGASISFFTCDILNGPLPEQFDVVMCSLFMHHLSEDEAVTALKTMSAAARKLLLVHDLRRCATGWWLAYLGTRLLSRSPIVHFDGPVSVEGAYTDAEFLQLARHAGLAQARVTRHWPCRFLLTSLNEP